VEVALAEVARMSMAVERMVAAEMDILRIPRRPAVEGKQRCALAEQKKWVVRIALAGPEEAVHSNQGTGLAFVLGSVAPQQLEEQPKIPAVEQLVQPWKARPECYSRQMQVQLEFAAAVE
jgi:hypothetical protein